MKFVASVSSSRRLLPAALVALAAWPGLVAAPGLAAGAAGAAGAGRAFTVRQYPVHPLIDSSGPFRSISQRTQCLPGYQRSMPSSPAGAVDRGTSPQRIDAIRRAYAAVVKYSAPSGQRMTFQLSRFRTLDKADFDQVRWFDLLTLPGGQVVQMETRAHRSNLRGGDRLEYVPAWREAPQDFPATFSGRLLAALTVTQAFRAGLEAEPRLAQVSSLTSFQVTATLAGRSRTYRAAFLWIDGPRGEVMLPYDQITDRVGPALLERLPPGHGVALRFLAGRSLKSGRAASATCFEGNNDLMSRGLSAQGTEDHISGAHGVDGIFSASCVCHADCTQDCQSNGFASCSEFGETGTCHRISSAGFASGDAYGAASGGAICTAQAGCAWRSCFGCLCGSASVSVGIGSVSVSPSDAAPLAKSGSYTCKPCTPTNAPTCNNNGICEAALGETHANCPNDCGAECSGPVGECGASSDECGSYDLGGCGEGSSCVDNACVTDGGGGTGDDGSGGVGVDPGGDPGGGDAGGGGGGGGGYTGGDGCGGDGGECSDGNGVTEYQCVVDCGGEVAGDYCIVN